MVARRRTTADWLGVAKRPTEGDEELWAAAHATFEQLPERLQEEVRHFLRGVFVGSQQSLEKHVDALYEAYAPVRRLLQRKYGRVVHLYRGEPSVTPTIRREFLSWTPSRWLAGQFAEKRGFDIIEADVDVGDIVAVLVLSHGKAYVEYLVRDRPRYHAERRTTPGFYGVVYFRIPEESFSKALVAAMGRSLKRSLQAVGGRILRIGVNQAGKHASAAVLLPASVVGDASYDIKLDSFRIEGLRPYASR